MLSSLLAFFVGLSRLLLWFGFHVGFHALLWENSADSLGFRVTSPGSRVGITGLILGLRWDESVVTLLVPRCYGFGMVLDFIDGWFSRRESSGPASRSALRALEGEAREFRSTRRAFQEGGRAHRHVVLNCPVFGHRPQAAGPIRASVRGGAPPARLLLQGTFMWRKITFYPCIKTLIRFTHL